MANKIFRINMGALAPSIEKVPDSWAGHGERGLTSTIIAPEVPPTCHPPGPNNKLVIAPGLLSGTVAASSGRILHGCQESPHRYQKRIKRLWNGDTASWIFNTGKR